MNDLAKSSVLLVLRCGGYADLALRAGFAFTLAVMFGFVLDDLSDFPSDRLVGKATALTRNQLSIGGAKLLSWCLAGSAVIVSPGGAWGKGRSSTDLGGVRLLPAFFQGFARVEGILHGNPDLHTHAKRLR